MKHGILLEKVRDICKLMPKSVTVIRKNAKPYCTTVYVKRGEIPEDPAQFKLDFNTPSETKK